MSLLWVRIPALTTLVEAGLDNAVRCTRNTDETGIILVARDLDYVVPSLLLPEICPDVWLFHCLFKNERCNAPVTVGEASHRC